MKSVYSNCLAWKGQNACHTKAVEQQHSPMTNKVMLLDRMGLLMNQISKEKFYLFPLDTGFK